MTYGNVKEFGNAGGSFGKRCLFFLTAFFPEIRLHGDRVNRLVKHLVIRGVRCVSNCTCKAQEQIYLHPDRTHNRIRSPRFAALGPQNKLREVGKLDL